MGNFGVDGRSGLYETKTSLAIWKSTPLHQPGIHENLTPCTSVRFHQRLHVKTRHPPVQNEFRDGESGCRRVVDSPDLSERSEREDCESVPPSNSYC